MERILKWLGGTVAVSGLVFGIVQFTVNQSVEASRPYLERKLKRCEETVEIAARIAVMKTDVNDEDVIKFRQWSSPTEVVHLEG